MAPREQGTPRLPKEGELAQAENSRLKTVNSFPLAAKLNVIFSNLPQHSHRHVHEITGARQVHL